MAQHILNDDEYGALQAKIRKLELDLEAARADQRALARETVPATVLAGLRAATPIVRFAVSNLHPNDVRGWPWRDLLSVIDALLAVGDGFDEELARDLRTFAQEAAGVERFRLERDGPGPRPPGPPAVPGDFGPKTVEAQIQHERRGPAAHAHAVEAAQPVEGAAALGASFIKPE